MAYPPLLSFPSCHVLCCVSLPFALPRAPARLQRFTVFLVLGSPTPPFPQVNNGPYRDLVLEFNRRLADYPPLGA